MYRFALLLLLASQDWWPTHSRSVRMSGVITRSCYHRFPMPGDGTTSRPASEQSQSNTRQGVLAQA